MEEFEQNRNDEQIVHLVREQMKIYKSGIWTMFIFAIIIFLTTIFGFFPIWAGLFGILLCIGGGVAFLWDRNWHKKYYRDILS